MEESTSNRTRTAPALGDSRLVYVIYDFTIKRGLRDNLIAASAHFEQLDGSRVRVEFPEPSVASQGEIWSNIVQPKLHEAAHVIAYIDKPNANVGFEVGYALGRGNRDTQVEPAIVALALHATSVPEWLQKPPFAGFNAVQFKDEDALIKTIDGGEGFKLREPVEPGTDLLFLCPQSGEKYLKSARSIGNWRILSGSGWALKDLPKRLAGVGAVVWMIPPTVDDRDGPENAALSVVAGFAKACGIELKVLLHSEAREVLDIVPEALQVADLNVFNKLIAKLHEDLLQHIVEVTRSASLPASVEVVPRPDVGDLPTLPHGTELKDRFIGRQRWLEDFYGALDGLRERWTRSLTGRNPVQLFWYHGLGGMGKTTLVRKAMVDTAERYAEARVAYWEWDQDIWRKPLDRPPDSAEDVFDAMAYRLAQLYGSAALDPYWRIESRIKSAAAQASHAKARFHSEHNDWLVKDQLSSALRSALHAMGLSRSKKELSDSERSRLFRRWIDDGGFEFDDQEASLDGARLQREVLLSCLTKLSQDAPLLLVFDTCEVLSAEAEQALRGLLVEICDRRRPVLVLIASRLAPDVGVTPGSKDTWRDSLGDDRLKIERFDDLTLTTTEIENYLQRYDPTLDASELAPELQRITLGVPLALRVLVEMEGGLKFLRKELTAWKEDENDIVSRESALYNLYEKLADRFLLHVHDDEDLRAIITLAITTDANKDLLTAYWGGRASWSERIRNLARRYSLLNEGDLHPVVRKHLRRSLRAGKYHRETKAIARELSEIAASAPEAPPFDERYFQQKLGRINLDSWISSDPTTLDVAPGVCMAMAYEQRLDSWFLLAAEVAEARQQSPGRGFLLKLQQIIGVEGRSLSYRDFAPRYRWMTALSNALLEEYFEWLGEAEKRRSWSPEERNAFYLIRALNAREAPDALLRFSKALQGTTLDPVPLLSHLGESLFDIARTAWLRSRTSPDVETSLSLALQIKYQSSSAHAALGEYFQRKNALDRARGHYVAAIELEPNNPSHLIKLADVSRLQRQFVDAAAWVGKALALEANYIWAHNQRGLIARDEKQYDGAVAAFEQAHALDAKEPAYAAHLADVYRLQKEYEKAKAWVDTTLSIQSDYAWAHNQRGLIAQDEKQYDRAIAAFEKAHELEPSEPAYAANLTDVYRLQKDYEKAKAWVDTTLSIQSDYAWAHNQRGLIARDEKQYDRAVAAFEQAHALDASEPAYPANLAGVYRLQKEYEKAKAWVDTTLSIQSDYAWAHNQRGLIAEDEKQYDRAIAAFEQAHGFEPKEPAYAANVAGVYRLRKEYDKAKAWVDTTLSIQSDYAWVHNQRGLIARDEKQYDLAIAAFEKGHELDPSEPAYAVNLAGVYRLRKEYEKAKAWVDTTLSIQSDYARAHNQRGLIARDEKQYDRAIAAFEQAFEFSPSEPEYAANLAAVYRAQKEYEKAKVWVDRALSIQSDYAWVHNQRGLIAEDEKQYKLALAAFERAHALDASEPAYAVNLTGVYRLQKDYDKAKAWVEKTLSIQPDYARAHSERGLIARDEKQYERAIAAFEQAHALDAREPAYAANLADVYRLQKDYDKAKAWVDMTLSIQSDYTWAHNQRGLIARDEKQYDGAVAAFEQAHALDAKEPAYAAHLADVYRLRKDYEKAKQWVDTTLSIQSDYTWAHNQRGLIAQDEKQYDRAIAAFEKAHELEPSEPAYAANLTDVYRLQKDYEKAKAWVDTTLSIQSDYAWAHNQRGLIAQDEKQYDRAVAAFEQAHRFAPSEPEYAANLVVVYSLQKEDEKAKMWLDKTLSIQPHYAWAHNQRGLIAQDARQYEEAIAAFKKAFELDPADAEFAYNIGWSLLETLNFADSEKWAHKALELDSNYVNAHNLLGVIAFSMRRWEDAALVFRRAAEMAPSEPILPCNLASVYIRQGRFTEAQEQTSIAMQIEREEPVANRLLATLYHLLDNTEAAQVAQHALALEEDFSSLLVFALTCCESIASTEAGRSLQALTRALDSATPLEREHDFEFVIYVLRVLQTVHSVEAVRAAVVETTSPVWNSLREAVTRVEREGSLPQDARVAAIVAAMNSPLTPKEQLLAAWAQRPDAAIGVRR